MRFTDPRGEGALDYIKCLYYAVQVDKYLKMCQKELEDMCKNNKFGRLEGELEFMNKYQAGLLGMDEAIAYCAYEKCPDKDLAQKWLKSCFKFGLTPPKPQPSK